ncbi:CYCLIN B2;4 [Hibiscus trionum]|uniref:CYCLIN B24 n=1 Tax=Hibiscus trionum TaxID=183268 RepID=A0A9W7H5R2_HIBTR|nr:CYCLIN B2;4 [Hibiscus trionum]
MRRSKENNPGSIAAPNGQDRSRMDGVEMVKGMEQNQRRALSSINQNIIGASLHHSGLVNKREFRGKDEVCNKKSALEEKPDNRRSLAVERVTNQDHFLEETRNRTQFTVKPGGLDDIEISDLEECEDDSDVAVPIFVKHTEAVLDETDGMDIEMEDMEDSIIDIDCSDSNDPLAVVEYVDGIYAHYKETEVSSCVSPNYMDRQFDINEKMRAILIDWLIEVHYKFELMEETLFLTINLIDRFLERCTVIRKKLQLVGMTAMLLACKYEEVSVPIVEDFVLISDKAYTRKDVLDMEKLMVNTLQFNMSVPTPYVFMRRFLKAAQSEKKLEFLSFFLIELCMVEYETLKFQPSLLAAAAIYTAQCSLWRLKTWTKTSEWHTKYTEDQLLECSKLMVTYHQKAGTGKLKGVHRKYSSYKFGYAAKTEPALFLLDP